MPEQEGKSRLQERYDAAMQRLHRWTMIFSGWQLGTRSQNDGPTRAVRDHRSVTMALRAEVSALVSLLIAKGVFTEEQYRTELVAELGRMEQDLEERFPGVKATDVGLTIDTEKFKETCRKYCFPG